MVGFSEDAYPLIATGKLTVTWRLWKYAHVKAGKAYNLGAWGSDNPGSIHIDDVRTARAADITDADAHEVGRPDAETLLAFCAGHTRATITPDTLLYRVAFHWSPESIARPRYTLEDIRKRCDRLEATSPYGPWTLAALRLIEANPQVISRDLASQIDIPRPEFKLLVRKLKALGLTVSYPIGYELTELGLEYVDSRVGEEQEPDAPERE